MSEWIVEAIAAGGTILVLLAMAVAAWQGKL